LNFLTEKYHIIVFQFVSAWIKIEHTTFIFMSDMNKKAFSIMQKVTGQEKPKVIKVSNKNPAAVALGRLGGLKGGRARAEKYSAEERSAIAKRAAKARWDRKGGDTSR
jgi:hypothetical protein